MVAPLCHGCGLPWPMDRDNHVLAEVDEGAQVAGRVCSVCGRAVNQAGHILPGPGRGRGRIRDGA